MAKPLDDRIAAALAKDARAATVADLRAELKAAIEATQADHDRQHALSVAATTPEAEADAAADETIKLSRKVTRLKAKADALATRHDELLNSEARVAWLGRYAEAEARRDELVADIREEWPKLVAGMVALFERINASDAECRQVGSSYGKASLVSAEAIARGVSPTFWANGAETLRLRENNIEALSPGAGGRPAWTAPRFDTSAFVSAVNAASRYPQIPSASPAR